MVSGECCNLSMVPGECCNLSMVSGECCNLSMVSGECCNLRKHAAYGSRSSSITVAALCHTVAALCHTVAALCHTVAGIIPWSCRSEAFLSRAAALLAPGSR